jgi:hypothetical protein
MTILYYISLAPQYQHYGAAHLTDIDGLVALIKNQYRAL